MTAWTDTAHLARNRRLGAGKAIAWTVGVGIWLLPLLWIDLTTYLVLTVAGITMGVAAVAALVLPTAAKAPATVALVAIRIVGLRRP